MKTDDLIAKLAADIKSRFPDEVPDHSEILAFIRHGHLNYGTVTISTHTTTRNEEDQAFILGAAIENWKLAHSGW